MGVVCSMIPDLDVIGLAFGVRYGDPWGHRGMTHSIFFRRLSRSVAGSGPAVHRQIVAGVSVLVSFDRIPSPDRCAYRWRPGRRAFRAVFDEALLFLATSCRATHRNPRVLFGVRVVCAEKRATLDLAPVRPGIRHRARSKGALNSERRNVSAVPVDQKETQESTKSLRDTPSVACRLHAWSFSNR